MEGARRVRDSGLTESWLRDAPEASHVLQMSWPCHLTHPSLLLTCPCPVNNYHSLLSALHEREIPLFRDRDAGTRKFNLLVGLRFPCSPRPILEKVHTIHAWVMLGLVPWEYSSGVSSSTLPGLGDTQAHWGREFGPGWVVASAEAALGPICSPQA